MAPTIGEPRRGERNRAVTPPYGAGGTDNLLSVSRSDKRSMSPESSCASGTQTTSCLGHPRKRAVIQPNNTCRSPRMGAIEPRVIINRPAGALAFLERLLSGA